MFSNNKQLVQSYVCLYVTAAMADHDVYKNRH